VLSQLSIRMIRPSLQVARASACGFELAAATLVEAGAGQPAIPENSLSAVNPLESADRERGGGGQTVN
jgi:hypothetical protein